MSYQLYWGDPHSHCAISYGHGTAEQALARARGQLDFCSITGHAFWPDMPTDRQRYGEIIDYHRQGFATLADNWERLLRLQEAATVEGAFIALPSYEWHSLEYGDHNVYAPGPELPLRDAPNLPALREAVSQFGGIAIPHHIGYGPGYRGVDWSTFRDDRSPVVEVFSLHGCSMSDDAPFPMLHDMGPRDFEGTAQAGWLHGHRFGVVGGTDHHAAYPGSHGDGRTGCFARSLSRADLWEALLARRVLAATGDKIDARLFVDDAWIGESIHAPGTRDIVVRARGVAALDRVELLKNERVIARFFPRALEAAEVRGPYRLRVAWGWGRRTEPVEWRAELALGEGELLAIDTCFSGQAIVSPQAAGAGEERDLPHELLERGPRRVAWRSVTQGNLSMRHDTTQALSLLVDAPLSARLTIVANGARAEYALGELLHRARSRFLRGWLSEALRVGPLTPEAECEVDEHVRDQPEREVDFYRLRVAQKNGHWAWLTPIWAER